VKSQQNVKPKTFSAFLKIRNRSC